MAQPAAIAAVELEIESYNAETKRIAALNQDRGTEGPSDMDALDKILESSKTIDEHDIQRAQLEHSIFTDHAKLGLENRKLTLQSQQMDNQHEMAKRQLSARPTPNAQSGGSNKSQSGGATG